MIGTNPPKTGSIRNQMGRSLTGKRKLTIAGKKPHRFRKVQSQAAFGIKLKTDF